MPSGEESVVVSGVLPGDQTVGIFPGVVDGGRFKQSQMRHAAISGAPKDGYVVAKIAGGETLALLHTFRVNKEGKSVPCTLVGACGDANAMVFEVRLKWIIEAVLVLHRLRGSEVMAHMKVAQTSPT